MGLKRGIGPVLGNKSIDSSRAFTAPVQIVDVKEGKIVVQGEA